MYRKVIKYTDFDGNECETEAYFNLSKTECVDLNFEYEAEGGLVNHLKNLFSNKINGELPKKPAIDFIKLIVDRSYGIRPKEDRSAFIKEDDNGKPLIRKFKYSPAYDELVTSLLNGEESLEDFVMSVLPYVPESDMNAAKKQISEEGFEEFLSNVSANTAVPEKLTEG